jgi:uncharacterized membrane-anchored protein
MRRFVALLLCGLLLTTGAAAYMQETRSIGEDMSLTFDGTTAICGATCIGKTSTDYIKATLTLYQGNTYIDSWSDEGRYVIGVSGQHGVTRGKSYTLKLNYTINGIAQPEQSVTKKCQ